MSKLSDNKMDLMKYKKAFLIFSVVVLIPGIVSLFVWGLKLSIDFSGGSTLNFKMTEEINTEELNTVVSEASVEVEQILKGQENEYTVRAKPIETEQIENIKAKVSEKFNGAALLSFETVGPLIGRETTANAVKSLTWATIGILIYIAYAFRNIPKPYSSFRFGIAAILAMLHDAFIVLGIFSILGHFYGTEIDSLFITAMLTIIGFSVHDTIVVFDRLRENLSKLPNTMSFHEVVNYSVVETLNRSLATSFTVIMTLTSLFLLGGESIKTFVLAMLIGIISGTYSSIFTASPILVLWEEYIAKRAKYKK